MTDPLSKHSSSNGTATRRPAALPALALALTCGFGLLLWTSSPGQHSDSALAIPENFESCEPLAASEALVAIERGEATDGAIPTRLEQTIPSAGEPATISASREHVLAPVDVAPNQLRLSLKYLERDERYFDFDGALFTSYYEEEKTTLRILTPIKNGQVHGNYEKYHRNGDLMVKATYIQGCPNGVMQGYYSNGRPCRFMTWDHGIQHGETRWWNEDGSYDSVKSGIYENNKKVAELPE